MNRADLNTEAKKAGVKRPELLPNRAAVVSAIGRTDGPPCATLREATEHLRRPFTPNAVRWKIQVNPKDEQGSALVVGYIDARLVAARLDAVVPGLWSSQPREVTGGVVCSITVDGVTRGDVGWSSGTGTNIQLKTVYSDSFKRAGVLFGIGAFLYAMPKQFIKASEMKKRSGRDGPTWWLTDSAEAKLRKGYEMWLRSEHPFGSPLDHGDVSDAQGDPETADAVEALEAGGDEIDMGADLEARLALLNLANVVIREKLWTTPQLKAQFVGAGATDNSSAAAAINTMTLAQVNELGVTINAALAEKNGPAA